MKRLPLDTYDKYPRNMREYLSQYGWHFSRKASEVAASTMYRRKENSPGEKEKITPYTKEDIESMMAKYGIKLQNNLRYDHVVAANMCKANYLKGSVPDEHHLCMFVREVIDDVDAGDGTLMRRWYAGMVARGEPVDWEEML